jgi:hypothetical protein
MDERTDHPGVRPDVPPARPPSTGDQPALILRRPDGQTLDLGGHETGRLCAGLDEARKDLERRAESSTFLPSRRDEYRAEGRLLKTVADWVTGHGHARHVEAAAVEARAARRAWRAEAAIAEAGEAAA